MIKQVIQQLRVPDAGIENLQERRYWLQCERAYTYQPIYQTDGRLMAVELLTVVTHPDNPSRRIAPDRYFAELAVRHRIDVVKEQLHQLEQKADFFTRHHLLASVNVDGPTLIAMRRQPDILAAMERLPWLRFELVEHIRLPKDSSFASMCEFGPLWLDDFGTGMANFSALSEVRYDYIKVARELFVMLRQSPEGRNLFTLLLQLMNRYCRGSIVSNIHLEGDKKPMQGRADIQARRLKLKELMPDVELMQKTLGELNGDADIRGTGNSVAALLGNSNGNLKLLMNDGLISRNLMEIVGLNVGNYIVGQIFGDDEVRVNCAAANLNITNGVARPQIFAFDTENALINVTGTASFASEQLDLTIDPESKGIRIITLRSPLYVRGTFKNPQAGVKPGPLIARGAVAAALATLVTPAAALLALISPSEGEANQCRTILTQMKQ
ncbi:cyclic-guanylate-specific phosphodiesterase [Salmonella enterica]|nr:cyclic-guanylate-specific phosphodiesterase [Salmonella enterica]